MKKISDHLWSKNIPVPNRDFSEISMKTEGKSTREKSHLGSGRLTTNPNHTVIDDHYKGDKCELRLIDFGLSRVTTKCASVGCP